jgi:hypothetical protein
MAKKKAVKKKSNRPKTYEKSNLKTLELYFGGHCATCFARHCASFELAGWSLKFISLAIVPVGS